MAIDIFSPLTMDTMVRMMPETPMFLKNMFFSTVRTEPTTKIAFDVYKGLRRVAPFVSERNVAKPAEKIGYKTNTAEAPLVAVKDITTIEDTMKRTPGELLMNSGITPEERAIELLAQTMTDFDAQIARREEVMCAQALFQGQIDVIGEDVNYNIDFGLTNKGTASVLWDTESSTADPIVDLQGWAVECAKKGYRNPDVCIMDRSAYQAFVDRCKALGYLNQWRMFDLTIEPEQRRDGVTFCGRLRNPGVDIFVYDQWYQDDWTTPGVIVEKPIVPKGYILLASTKMTAKMYYGVLTFTDQFTNTFRSVMGTRGADSWVQKEPAARFFKMAARPLPVPQEIDSWYVAQVSSTT